jgi:hypothetical protein
MTKHDLLPLAREAMQALSEHYNEAMRQARDDAGMEQADWGLVFGVFHADPRPVSSAYLLQLSPYASLAGLEQRLAGAVSRGFVESTADRAVRLTSNGRQALMGSLEAAWAAMAKLEPMPSDDMRRLIDLLNRVVDASMAAPQPRDKRHVLASRKVDPGEDAPIVARLDQHLTDLVMFRDDVHPAAWREYNINGPAWEIFTLICEGEVATLETLTERLAHRQHPPELIPQSLQDLVARGWIDQDHGACVATEEGRALRREAEDETDRLFYAPWACLSDAEMAELRALLEQARDGARALVAQNTG